MPTESAGLIENPELAILLLLIGAFVGVAFERLRARLRRRTYPSENRGRRVQKRGMAPHVRELWHSQPTLKVPKRHDAADQLRIVMKANFSIQPLLNKSEARLFRELERLVLDRNPQWQVMAQVSLGEVLRSNDSEAFRCINSKRVDLLLMDEECQPRHAVEYQGAGHYQDTAAARDAVKKEALRRAGVGYHEVLAGHTTPSDLRRLMEKLVDEPAADTVAKMPASTVGQSLRQA